MPLATDRALAAVTRVGRGRLQLIGVGALFIAAKYGERAAPDAADLAAVTDGAFAVDEVTAMEALLLRALRWELTVPTAVAFAGRLLAAVAAPAGGRVAAATAYALELAALDYGALRWAPSEVAAGAVLLARTDAAAAGGGGGAGAPPAAAAGGGAAAAAAGTGAASPPPPSTASRVVCALGTWRRRRPTASPPPPKTLRRWRWPTSAPPSRPSAGRRRGRRRRRCRRRRAQRGRPPPPAAAAARPNKPIAFVPPNVCLPTNTRPCCP